MNEAARPARFRTLGIALRVGLAAPGVRHGRARVRRYPGRRRLGSAGAGGSGGRDDAGACDPPVNPTRSALCIEHAPELIEFERDPKRDGMGTLLVQIFDSPEPESFDGGQRQPIALQFYPSGDAREQTSIRDLPMIRFDDLPSTVYVRHVFFDNPTGAIAAGTWTGGYDLTRGFGPQLPLKPVVLTPGQTTRITEPLRALRLLRVQLNLADDLTPLDDGQGPGAVLAFRRPELERTNPSLGFNVSDCIRVAPGRPAALEAAIIGAGKFYLFAILNDFNAPSAGLSAPPGSLVSTQAFDGGIRPLSDSVTIPESAYSVDATVTLREARQARQDAGAGYSCEPSGTPDGG